MFEAYKVAVKLMLVSNVANELRAISNQFKLIGDEALAAEAKIKSLRSSISSLKKVAAASVVMGGAGYLGLKAVGKAMGPGMEYAHQLNVLTMHGLKQKELAEATAKAWQMTKENMTTTPTQNLKTIMDLHNVLGHLHEAIDYAPMVAKIGTVLASSTEGKLRSNSSEVAQDVAFTVAKGLDIRNAAGSLKEFNLEANKMTKVITAFGSRVTPEDYRMTFKYGRQAIPGLSNEFLYEQLPTFMLEMKGKNGSGGAGGFGTSLAAFYRFFVQGVMPKAAAANMESLGLLPHGATLKTTTTGTMLSANSHIKNVELARSNPFEYVQKELLPAIWKKFGKDLTNSQVAMHVADAMRGAAQTGIFAAQQYALKAQNVYRDQRIVQGAMDTNQGYKQAYANDPYVAMAAFKAQLETLETAFTMGIIPFVLPGLMKLSSGLNDLSQWARANPAAASNITKGIIITSTALLAFGSILGVGTAVAIMRASAALNRLNATLAVTTAVASGGGAAGAAGKGALAAGGTSLAARFGWAGLGVAAVGLLGYLGYEALNKTGSRNAFANSMLASNPLYNEDLRKQTELMQSKNVDPTMSLVQFNVDGRTLADALAPHLEYRLSLENIGSQNSFNTAKSPTPVGTNFGTY